MEEKHEIDKLLERITNLTLNLQKEVAELKEDTLVNASHIQIIKSSHSDNLNNLNSSVSGIVSSTNEFVEELEQELNKKSGNNYTEFLKSLLAEDFNALQKEMLEEGKREILNAKSSAKKSGGGENIFFSFLKDISPFLSLFSFILLIIICIKFNLFGMLLK
ncbi:hypothetical protein [Helicobacter rodentium]|uniref:hypothetical protein n=1 Tax=Helicobacter rodentium TaxID=59617 RepID=UPI0023F25D5E|nr:hypothetical protein [Helicobacter rodentium]